MTNRYVTEKEKAGSKRRMDNYLARLEEAGIKRRQLLLTDAELARVKELIACWRGEGSALTAAERKAAVALNPCPATDQRS